jgi:hypothetical protein
VTHRGGTIRGGREERLTSLIRRIIRPLPEIVSSTTKNRAIDSKDQEKGRSRRPKARNKTIKTSATSVATRTGVIRPIDVQVRVGAGGHISLFLYYVRQFEGI